jgi:hypothetical protein
VPDALAAHTRSCSRARKKGLVEMALTREAAAVRLSLQSMRVGREGLKGASFSP